MSRTLIIGYGNPDRQDDGIAWHILAAVASSLGYPLPETWEEGFQPSPHHADVELSFSLQLVPEMAEMIANFDRVCFVDAHTGRVPEEIHCEQLTPEMQNSPFTHHMTPATLVYLAKQLYNNDLDAVLFSVRGYEFGFSHQLSPDTAAILPEAVSQVLDWLSA